MTRIWDYSNQQWGPSEWWCPNCGDTQSAPVADQPDPEPQMCGALLEYDRCHLPPGHTGDCVDEPPAGVPVGDDTPLAPELGPDVLEFMAAFDEVERIAVTDYADKLACHAAVERVRRARHAVAEGTTPDEDRPYIEGLTANISPDGQSIVGGPVGVPVGDDTPAPYTAISAAERQEDAQRAEMGGDTPADERNISGLYPPGRCSLCGKPTPDPEQQDVCDECYGPPGDDTPAPTAPDRWTVGWVAMPSSMTRGLFKDGERVPLPKVARILNRAGATPSAQNDTEETT